MDDSIPQKICTGCHSSKPALKEFFWSDKSKPDGLHSLCKWCCSPEGKAWRKQKQVKDAPPEGYKKCTACGSILLATSDYFYHRQGKPIAECKECWENRKKKFYQNHPDFWHTWYVRNTDKRRKYRLENAEKARNQARVYRQNNLEECRRRDREYHRLHAEKFRRQAVHYKKANRERYTALERNRKMAKRSIPGTFTAAQVAELLKRQKYRCYYCYEKFKRIKGKYVYHIDHTFPISRASGDDPINDISYLVLACPSCNLKKGKKYPWEFFEGGRLL